MPSSLTLDDARTRMATIRGDFDRTVSGIRNSNLYHGDGKRQAIAKALVDARKLGHDLRQNFTVDTDGKRVALSGKLFGIPKGADPATVLIHRDAADRAAKLDKADDAAAVLKRALDHGDAVLARAVASHAHGQHVHFPESGWGSVVTSYAENTGLSGDLDELKALPSGGLAKLATCVLFSVRAPAEVQTFRGDCPSGELALIAEGRA